MLLSPPLEDPLRLVPKACLEKKPTKQSLFFSGAYINLHAIQRAQGVDLGLLSSIFRCKRQPTLTASKKISSALGMGLEAFLEALEIRKKLIEDQIVRLKVQHDRRLYSEYLSDVRDIRSGRPVKPRLPGLSSPAA